MKIFDYINFFDASGKFVVFAVIVFLVMQVVVEILKFRGIIAPEIISIRTRIERRKQEKETIQKMAELLPTFSEVPEMLKNTGVLLGNVDLHYSKDNIKMRDDWIKNVNQKLEEHDALMKGLIDTVNKNSENTLSLLIESKRSAIIDFASKVIDPHIPVTRAEFNRIFRIHKEYDEIIKENNIKNGEVDIAIGLICESYEEHMRNHTFLEDIRGFTSTSND